MSYKLTEFYALSIPLFMPSIVYFQCNGGIGLDRSTISKNAYCRADKIKDNEMKPHPSSIHPNLNRDIDNEAENYFSKLVFEFLMIQYTCMCETTNTNVTVA